MATNVGWVLPPTASNQDKKAKEDQLKALRKLARTAEAEYLQLLVTFQYGEEGAGALPEAESYSLVPPEVKKKLELKKKEDLKMKRKDEESARKQDPTSRARESYGSSRYRPVYRPRPNSYPEAGGHPYPGAGSGAGQGLYSRAGYTPYPAQSYNQYPGNGLSTSSSYYPHNSFQGQGLQAPGIQEGWIAQPQIGFPPQYAAPQGFSGAANYPVGGASLFKPSPWYAGLPPPPPVQNSYSSRELQERKKNSKCGRCDVYGHWHGDNMCRPEDVERKLAKLALRDGQYHAEATALRLIQHQPEAQDQGN